MSLMFFTAAIVAVLGVVTLACGLGIGTSGSLKRSHDSSIGHNCWISHSWKDFPALNLANQTFPSLLLISFTTTPIFHLLLLRSSLCTIIRTTSPCSVGVHLCFGWGYAFLSSSWSTPLSIGTITHQSLQLPRYLARFLRSLSLTESTSSLDNRLGWPNILLWGVSTGSCISS